VARSHSRLAPAGGRTGDALLLYHSREPVPLGIGPERETLRTIRAGSSWVAALLASMLCWVESFGNDYQDGTLEQLLLTPQPAYLVVLAKVLAHWIVAEVPLVVHCAGAWTSVRFVAKWSGNRSCVSLAGNAGSKCHRIGWRRTHLGLRAANVLVALLVLPLYIPVLIFGSGRGPGKCYGIEPASRLLLLGATLIVSLVFAPWATSAALRISVE